MKNIREIEHIFKISCILRKHLTISYRVPRAVKPYYRDSNGNIHCKYCVRAKLGLNSYKNVYLQLIPSRCIDCNRIVKHTITLGNFKDFEAGIPGIELLDRELKMYVILGIIDYINRSLSWFMRSRFIAHSFQLDSVTHELDIIILYLASYFVPEFPWELV